MSDVRLIPLGVGGAFTAQYYTTCLALGLDDDWLLIECPHPIRKLLRDASLACGIPLDLDRVRGVALSHLHADHSSGMEDYGFYTYFALGRRATVAVHPEVSARLWDGLLAGGMGESRPSEGGASPVSKTLDDYFDLLPLKTDSAVKLGPFAIECRPTIHPIPTTAFRITVGGRTLAFSADTAFDPTLIDWLAPADLIVHEASDDDESTMHTPYTQLAHLPEALRRRMRLIHYSDKFDLSTSVIEPLQQGRCYHL
jgi:ribonuclease BN (tRNA processing enzyme)